METKIKERMERYCDIYQKALEIAARINPDNARYVATDIFREVAKDLRSEFISELQRKNRKSTEIKASDSEDNGNPATEKQRHALYKFGLKDVPENLTKEEASEILNNLIGLSREGNKKAIQEIVEKLNAGDG